MREFHLTVVHRTRDPKLLEFLTTIRKEQPTREQVSNFSIARHLNKGLELAVATGLGYSDASVITSCGCA